MEHQQFTMIKDAKVGDAITFELASTGKIHCHTILSIDEEGNFHVTCDTQELTVTPAEVTRLWSR